MTALQQAPSGGPTPMRAAKSPTGPGAVGVVGPVLALLLAALGALLLRDAVVTAQGSSSAWTVSATEVLVGAAPAGWMVPAGLVVALVGLWLVVTALRRRTRRSVALTSRTGAFIGTADLARRVSAAAQEVDGVLSATTTATRRAVTVKITTTGDRHIPDAATRHVTEALAGLARPPRVRVRVTSHDDGKATS